MDASESAYSLIKDAEGFVKTLYDDPAGHCTIGYGHLVHKGACDGKDATEAPFLGGISEADAVKLLKQDAQPAAKAVSELVKVPLTQNQFDALVVFVYNVGRGNFADSTLLKKLNGGQYSEVRSELMRWTKAGGVELPGLVKRRKAEADLFEKA